MYVYVVCIQRALTRFYFVIDRKLFSSKVYYETKYDFHFFPKIIQYTLSKSGGFFFDVSSFTSSEINESISLKGPYVHTYALTQNRTRENKAKIASTKAKY